MTPVIQVIIIAHGLDVEVVIVRPIVGPGVYVLKIVAAVLEALISAALSTAAGSE